MRVLFLDCFSGISGDMTVGALCDLGVTPSTFEWELSQLNIGDFHMHFEREKRQNIEGVKFGIHEGETHREEVHDHDHSHEHEPHHCCEHDHDHSHGRSHREIKALIEGSELSAFVKQKALAIFQRIAVAEGKIHGMPAEDVTFHEVGALDSIADIVCACIGIEQLGVERVHVSSLQEGRGWIDCAHGRFPIPAPATVEILAGIPFEQIDQPFEFITPTGAAIVAEFGASFGPMPRMKTLKVGYGVGTRTLEDRPNVLRAVLGETEEAGGYETDTVTRIETNLDDLSPEIAGAVMDQLLAAGALDVFFVPAHMKKNRPGFLLTALCELERVEALAEIIFRETTAFGLRTDRVDRLKLARRSETVETKFGPVSVKIGSRGGEDLQVAPEFESCRAVAALSAVPIRDVYEAAIRAARSAG